MRCELPARGDLTPAQPGRNLPGPQVPSRRDRRRRGHPGQAAAAPRIRPRPETHHAPARRPGSRRGRPGLRAGRADVFETLAFRDSGTSCTSATQSGPMLVIDGALHPRFLPDSPSYYIRNGVGTSSDGRRVVFAISRNAVTFHQFGSLFRDHLKLPNALYFDGNISRLHAPQINRSDAGFMMGPVVGVTADKP